MAGRIGLFIPCYIDQFYPRVAIATLELLESMELDVVYPDNQTCCGQPLANAGFEREAVETMTSLADNFSSCDYVVSPSGSCVYHVRCHYDIIGQTGPVQSIRSNLLELCEFLTRVPGLKRPVARFPYRTGFHQSCHWQRGLRLGSSSERMEPAFSVAETLLKEVEGLELIPLGRSDECCGFGGSFAVTEEAVSVSMGRDRLDDHLANKAEVITGTDVSCLMHLEGLVRRNRLPLKVMHIAEILNSRGQHGPSAKS